MKQHLSFPEQRAWPVILLFMLLMILCLFNYKSKYEAVLREVAFRSLNDGASFQTTLLSEKLESQFSLLESTANVLSNNLLDASSEPLSNLSRIVDISDFTSMASIQINGFAVQNNGYYVDLSTTDYFQTSLSGKRAISLITRDNGESYFALSVPVLRSGREMGVLAGYYPMQVFMDLLISSNSTYTSTALMLQSDGAVIAGSDPSQLLSHQTDFTQFLERSVSRISTSSAEEVRADLQDGVSGALDFYYEGQHLYATYSPLHVNDWFVLNIVSSSIAESASLSGRDLSTGLSVQLIILILLMMAFLLLREKGRRIAVMSGAEKLRISEERYRVLEDLTDNVFFEGSLQDDTMEFNATYRKVFHEGPPHTSFHAFLMDNEHVYEDDRAAFRVFGDAILAGSPVNTVELRYILGNASLSWYRLESVTLFDGKNCPQRVIGKITDIDAQKRAMIQLQSEAERDPLTNLLNRGAIRHRVNAFFESGGARNICALIMIDIDAFKSINDGYGHQAGDLALIAFSKALLSCFRSTDPVSRLGGDEFMIFMGNAAAEEIVTTHVEAVRETVHALRFPEYPALTITCSIGVALYPQFGNSFESLYALADRALYHAKRSGKDRFCVYSHSLDGTDAK